MCDRLHGVLHTQSLMSHLAYLDCWAGNLFHDAATFNAVYVYSIFSIVLLSHLQCGFFPSLSCNFYLWFSLILQARVESACNILLV